MNRWPGVTHLSDAADRHQVRNAAEPVSLPVHLKPTWRHETGSVRATSLTAVCSQSIINRSYPFSLTIMFDFRMFSWELETNWAYWFSSRQTNLKIKKTFQLNHEAGFSLLWVRLWTQHEAFTGHKWNKRSGSWWKTWFFVLLRRENHINKNFRNILFWLWNKPVEHVLIPVQHKQGCPWPSEGHFPKLLNEVFLFFWPTSPWPSDQHLPDLLAEVFLTFCCWSFLWACCPIWMYLQGSALGPWSRTIRDLRPHIVQTSWTCWVERYSSRWPNRRSRWVESTWMQLRCVITWPDRKPSLLPQEPGRPVRATFLRVQV